MLGMESDVGWSVKRFEVDGGEGCRLTVISLAMVTSSSSRPRIVMWKCLKPCSFREVCIRVLRRCVRQ
jgi:hypothetical protein